MKFLQYILRSCFKILSALVFITLSTFSTIYSQSLPPVRLDFASYAVTEDGKLLGYFGEKHRVDLKSTGNVSKWVIYSLIATEDRDFYQHDGVSYKGIGRAILKTLTGSTQGGSTLTMQLARNLFLTREQTLSRKFTEISIAQEIEKKYSKDKILLMYLNTVYFGNGAYGIWAASQTYFSKTPDKLTVAEGATIVGLLKSPTGYDPVVHPDKALSRRNEVMYNLVEVGKLSRHDFDRFKKQPLGLNLGNGLGRHFLELIRREAVDILHRKGLSLNKDQLKITTTLDYHMQKAAEDAVKAQWNQIHPSIQAAQIGIISVEPGTGKIKALIGGNPKSESRGLNHAVQIKRQPGSSFKPFLYGQLLEKGFTLATPLNDSYVSVKDPYTGDVWSPSNYDNKSSGVKMPMINAVQHSVNLAAAHAITELTSPDSVIAFAHKLGISSELPAYPSIALGTGEVSPLEMAASFAVFASEGTYAKPYSIVKIEDSNHHLIYSASPQTSVVLDSATAYLVTTALKTVIDSGTAHSARKYYKGAAAGKTGTTQNSADVWFVGYTPKLSTAIWIGYDNPQKKLSGGFQYGGSACAPVWGRMMSSIAQNEKGFYNAQFTRPSTIQYMELCTDSGEPASPACIHRKLYPVDFLKLQGECKIHGLHFDNSL